MDQNMQGAQGVESKKGKSKIGCWIAGCLTALVVFVLFIGGITGIAFWATSGTVKVVDEQLSYLRRGDIESAYLLTSGDFRKATNLEQFKRFISANPSLAQNKSSSFTSREIKNGIATIKGTLTAIDGSRSPIEYELVKENDVWKILYIGLSPKGVDVPVSKESQPFGVTVIEKVEVGTQRNPNGSIKDASVKLPQGIGDVRVSAYISGAKKGQKVNAVWYFGEEKITNPVVNEVREDGDIISQFYLGAPTNGWPTGNYRLVIYIDDGKIMKEISYTIGR